MKLTIDLFGIIKMPVFMFALWKVWGTPVVWVMLYLFLAEITWKFNLTRRT